MGGGGTPAFGLLDGLGVCMMSLQLLNRHFPPKLLVGFILLIATDQASRHLRLIWVWGVARWVEKAPLLLVLGLLQKQDPGTRSRVTPYTHLPLQMSLR